jgi:serine/threonine protein kinase
MSELGVGAEFAGHRIDAVIGSGGMGIVYRARNLMLDRDRALKVIAKAPKGEISLTYAFPKSQNAGSWVQSSRSRGEITPLRIASSARRMRF